MHRCVFVCVCVSCELVLAVQRHQKRCSESSGRDGWEQCSISLDLRYGAAHGRSVVLPHVWMERFCRISRNEVSTRGLNKKVEGSCDRWQAHRVLMANTEARFERRALADAFNGMTEKRLREAGPMRERLYKVN